MKKKFTLDLYPVTIFLVVSNDPAWAAKQVGKILGDPDKCTREECENNGGFVCHAGQGTFVIYMSKRRSKDPEVVCHEIFHLTHFILQFLGGDAEQFSADHQEPGAYLNGYLSKLIFNAVR
jgi:hypothetical protein